VASNLMVLREGGAGAGVRVKGSLLQVKDDCLRRLAALLCWSFVWRSWLWQKMQFI
jgi:hypothetical protein